MIRCSDVSPVADPAVGAAEVGRGPDARLRAPAGLPRTVTQPTGQGLEPLDHRLRHGLLLSTHLCGVGTFSSTTQTRGTRALDPGVSAAGASGQVSSAHSGHVGAGAE